MYALHTVVVDPRSLFIHLDFSKNETPVRHF